MRCIRCSCVYKWAVTWWAMKKVCKVGNVRVRILGTYVLHEWRWERHVSESAHVLACKSRKTQTLTWQSFELWPLGLQSSSQANQPRRPPHDCNNSECPNRHFIPSLLEQVANTWLVQKTTAHLIVRAPCHSKLHTPPTAVQSCLHELWLSHWFCPLWLCSITASLQPSSRLAGYDRTYTTCVSYFVVTHSDPLHKLCLSFFWWTL